MSSQRKNVTLSEHLSKLLEEKAKELGISQSSLIAIALSEYLKNHE